jgi:hypothetical protein
VDAAPPFEPVPEAKTPQRAETPLVAAPNAETPPNSEIQASAEPEPDTEESTDEARQQVPFGSKGQWVLMAGSTGFGISNETFSASDAKFFNVNGELGLDTFVVRNFSLGFDIEGEHSVNQGYGADSLVKTTTNSFAGGVRFGFNLPLGRAFSLYPRLTLGLKSTHTEQLTDEFGFSADLLSNTSSSSVGPWLNLYLPLLIQQAPHFFLAIGPRIEHEFGVQRGGQYDGAQSTTLGAVFEIGGYWGGSGEAEAVPATPARTRAFGKADELVLTVDTSASLTSLSYSNGTASNTSYNFQPGLDYFVIDGISLGFDAFISHSSGSELDSSYASTDFEDSSFGIAPRIGANIPLLEGVSFWPRLQVGYGTLSQTESSLGAENQHSNTRVWVDIFLPLLVPVAPHFFVGAGPEYFRELVDSDQNDVDNDATAIDARFLMGGWL